MRAWITAFCCLLLIVSSAWAQGDRGTITGTVADPTGAMVPNAAVEAKNANTGAVYQAASSATGNYSLVQLPAGPYQITITVPGFKQYQRIGLTVMVAQTLRIDVKLEVGVPTEIISVSADAPLLKTESGELSHNISTDKLDDLPILSATGMRDPFAAVSLIPGVDNSAGLMRVNGMPGFTMALRIDGQDATQQIWTMAYGMSTPSVDSVEQTAVQTSNFAAEYGQAGGGILNMTLRSGTNKLHGSAFDYWRNEALNAQRPYLNYDYEQPGYSKPRDRQHDYGFNLGGPVYIPKVYDGRDKTFFFYSFEQNRLSIKNGATYTLPSAALQSGNFTQFLGDPSLMSQICYNPDDPSTCGFDPLGNRLVPGTIYDPSTTQTVTRNVHGVPTPFVVRSPFMGCDGLTRNQICMTGTNAADLDPVAMRYQGLYPTLTNNGLTNNYSVTWPRKSVQTINAFKIDHSFSSKLKLTGSYSLNSQSFDTFTDGLDVPLSSGRMMTEKSHTIRITADYTISPTMVLQLGAGLMHFVFKDPQPNVNYNVEQELGMPGTFSTVAPSISLTSLTRGGLRDTGPVAYGNTWQIKPTGTASLAWVKGSHAMKFGAEVRVDSHPSTVITPSNGKFIFDPVQTSLPYLGTANDIGHPYASFLLGMYNKGEIGLPNRFHLGKHAIAFYAQDSWKITQKLTLDYGLRWDYQTALQETEGRMPTFSPTAINPVYNLPGDAIFKKDVGKTYPHAWGPRLGLAYQFMPKTVLRAGIGISYGQTGALEMWNLRMGSFVRFGPNSQGYNAIGLLRDGPSTYNSNTGQYDPVVPVWPNRAAGQAPAAPGSDYMPWIHDRAGRPPRQIQWSIGIQREVLPDLLVDIAYVGNRGIWWNSNGAINDPNRVTPQILADHNFNLSSVADRNILLKPWSAVTTAEAAAHSLTIPYSGFAGNVNQALRPFPHIGNIFQIWAPIGKTWYDSLQVKVTKRYSHGLDFSVAYSWQKELTLGAETNDTAFVTAVAVNNINDFKSNKTISGISVPHRVVIAANYQVPTWNTNKFVSMLLRDWTIGAMLTYASGQPIMAPRANWNSNPGHDIGNLLKLCSNMSVFGGCNGSMFFNGPSSYATRVKGQELFVVDPNSSYDPRTQLLLNADAWTNPAEGQYGAGAPYYSDYRYRRRPSENMSLGRNFPIREGMKVSIRVELMNIFNRVQIPNPYVDFGSNTAEIGGAKNASFGSMNSFFSSISDTAGQRTGQIVARFTF